MPSPIRIQRDRSTIVYISYDENLQKILGRKNESFALLDGSKSEDFLINFFEIYPHVFEKAIPGTLQYLINGAPSLPYQLLQTGDSISMTLISMRELIKTLKEDIDAMSQKLSLSFGSEEVCEFVRYKDPKEPQDLFTEFKLDKEEDSDEIFIMEDLLFKAWSSFPRESLGGKSQIQVMHQDILEEFRKTKSKEK